MQIGIESATERYALTIGRPVPKSATVALRTKKGRCVLAVSIGLFLRISSAENPVGRAEFISTIPSNFSGASLTTDMPIIPPMS